MEPEPNPGFVLIADNVINEFTEKFHIFDRPQENGHGVELINRETVMGLVKLLGISVAQISVELARTQVSSEEADALKERVAMFESVLANHRVSISG